jgi:hypothetical protein
MGGVSSQYTLYEKVEIQVGYADVATGGWNASMILKNSGSSGATITHCFVNGVPVDGYNATAIVVDEFHVSFPNSGLTLESGESSIIRVYISGGAVTKLTSGTTVNIQLHSSGGMEYTKLIKLP